MERWENRCRHGGGTAATSGSYHRSFSSSLLDAIYWSMDEGSGSGGRREGSGAGGASARGGRREQFLRLAPDFVSTRKQPNNNGGGGYLRHSACARGGDDRCFTATAAVERMRSEAVAEKPAASRRASAAEIDGLPQRDGRTQQHPQQQRERKVVHSTSSSSESSYGAFSSSDVEPVVLSAASQPKAIRTSLPPKTRPPDRRLPTDNKQKAEGSIKERFRASKLYQELKKAKTPTSPGARLAGFLNALFAAAGGNASKTKANNPPAGRFTRAGDTSFCSSASSYSRSRLSRTPSSMGNTAYSGAGERRSVRFCPVGLVVDDQDCRRGGQKCRYANEKPEYSCRNGLPCADPPPKAIKTREPPPSHLAAAEERRRAGAAARGCFNGFDADERGGQEEKEEDDGAASYSSSDLFELENLAAVGVGGGGETRYRNELPVYETTRLDSNRAIARDVTVQQK